jgi:hypothetical protein
VLTPYLKLSPDKIAFSWVRDGGSGGEFSYKAAWIDIRFQGRYD